MPKPPGTNAHIEPLPSRSWKKPLVEILGIGGALVFLTGAILAMPGGEGGLAQIWAAAPVAGNQALEHIGWGLGIFVAVLLGFYVLIIGGQLVAPEAVRASTHRKLGTTAEVMAATLVPATLLIIAACLDDTTKAGSLIIVLPAVGTTFFLAVQLGGFVVFEDKLKLAAALRNLEWAQERLEKLHVRKTCPAWLAVALNSFLSAAAAWSVAFCLAPPTAFSWIFFGPYLLFALGLTTVYIAGVSLLTTARDRWNKIAAWTLVGSLLLVSLSSAAEVFLLVAPVHGIGLFTLIAFCTLSALWPHHFRGNSWSARSVGTARAVKQIELELSEATQQVKDLSASLLPRATPPLYERTRLLLRGFGRRSKNMS